MKKYNMDSTNGTHTIKVDFQCDEYKGYIIRQIGGNCKGYTVLESATDFYDNDFIANTVKLRFDDDVEWFEMELSDEYGNLLVIEGEIDELADYIVGVKIIDFVSVGGGI